MVQAGKLRQQVTIQQLVTAPDGLGGTTTTWQAFATRWAAIEPLTGREYFDSQQTTSKVSTRIRLRYLAGVKPAMRALYGARIYSIEAMINVEEKNRELQLLCTEAV